MAIAATVGVMSGIGATNPITAVTTEGTGAIGIVVPKSIGENTPVIGMNGVTPAGTTAILGTGSIYFLADIDG